MNNSCLFIGLAAARWCTHCTDSNGRISKRFSSRLHNLNLLPFLTHIHGNEWWWNHCRILRKRKSWKLKLETAYRLPSVPPMNYFRDQVMVYDKLCIEYDRSLSSPLLKENSIWRWRKAARISRSMNIDEKRRTRSEGSRNVANQNRLPTNPIVPSF